MDSVDNKTGNAVTIKKFLADLKEGADLIVKAYNDSLDDVDYNEQNLLERLKDQRILMSSFNGYRINPMLNRLLNSVLDINRSRFIDVGIKSRIPALERTVRSYIDHKRNNDREIANEILRDIEQLTFEIIYDAQNAVNNLSNRIHTKFGFVHSLKDKITENESTIEIADKLVDNLTAYRYEDMLVLVNDSEFGGDQKLYNILCVNLLGELHICQENLNVTIIKLQEMLAIFRKQITQTNLLRAFSEKFVKDPSYELSESYILNISPNHLFKHVTPFNMGGHIPLQNEVKLPIIEDIFNNLKPAIDDGQASPSIEVDENTNSFDTAYEIKTEQYTYEQLEEDLTLFFKDVIKNKVPTSAISYHQNHNLPYKKDHWLFAVASFYEDQPKERKVFFNAPQYTAYYQHKDKFPKLTIGNKIIEDITLSINKEYIISRKQIR